MSEEGGIVYIGDLSEERGTSLEKQVQNSKYVKLDVTSLDNWKQAAEHIVMNHKRIDVLVNCAGLVQTGAPMEEMDLKRDWDLLININLNGTFYGMYSSIPYMKENGGSIVNISSVSSLVAQ